MRYVTYPTAGLTLSRLAFGCAPVMGRVGRRAALRAMELAWERGVTHFDVARSYGYGEAEGILGAFARGRRDRITIATKFGIAAVPNAGLLRLVKPLARAVVSRLPGLRAYARAATRQVLTRGRYDLAAAQTSFEESLRQLQTPYVDILFIHEPAPDEVLSDELVAYLERLRAQGRIGVWGIATRREWTAACYERLPVKPQVVQCEYNIAQCAPFGGALGRVPAILHSPFGGTDGLARLRGTLARQLGACRVKHLSREELGRLLLEYALHSGTERVVLCSMFSPAHLGRNVDAVDQPRYLADIEQLGATAPAAGSGDGSAGAARGHAPC